MFVTDPEGDGHARKSERAEWMRGASPFNLSTVEPNLGHGEHTCGTEKSDVSSLVTRRSEAEFALNESNQCIQQLLHLLKDRW
ncbi:unnamed protein product [Leptosia nina]|uniref:Uncharacterized protein n=1 Tax=Leptosia nina TaxID=320188 RepID=A0AAV1JQ48_9NEOP